MKKRYKITALLSAAVISFSFAGCGNVGFRLSDILESVPSGEEWNSASSNEMSRESSRELSHESSRETSHESSGESSRASSRETSDNAAPEKTYKDFYSMVPPYDGSPSVAINNDKPFFDRSALTLEPFEKYSSRDSLGRCGAAYADVCRELMPTESRGIIGTIKPTGWHTVKYAGIEGNYLYNRCHLIGYQLTAENANEDNLITGTRYMNVDGMQPFENKVADYVSSTGHHVHYRVTPVFLENDLLSRGVLIEAQSVEDDGIQLCRFCYNVQPGITINYSDGSSEGPEFLGSDEEGQSKANETPEAPAEAPPAEEAPAAEPPAPAPPAPAPPENAPIKNTDNVAQDYVLNHNTKKFHYPDCRSVNKIKPKNREDVHSTREEIISQGFDPCGICHP